MAVVVDFMKVEMVWYQDQEWEDGSHRGVLLCTFSMIDTFGCVRNLLLLLLKLSKLDCDKTFRVVGLQFL